MSSFIVYLVLMLDGLVGFLIWLSIFSSIVLIFMSVCIVAIQLDPHAGSGDKNYCIFFKKHIFKIFLLTLFINIITIATPTTKQMCAIYLIPKIVNSERVQNLGDKSLTVIENKFSEWLNETIKNKEEE